MTTQSVPPIPPRPSRTKAQSPASTNDGSGHGSGHGSGGGGGGAIGKNMPSIPPRPAARRYERSASPSRDSYAPSPLNEPNFVAHKPAPSEAAADAAHRPVSVSNMPSVGQEGMEYATICTPDTEDKSESKENKPGPATETRNVAEDLKLYAPRPSNPNAGLDAVTRTDSSQAAALGLGRDKDADKSPGDDKDSRTRTLGSMSSISSTDGADHSTPVDDTHDQPDILDVGQRVPMYPNAGIIQAPSTSPHPQFAPGIGFHNDGSRPPLHGRKKSSRAFEGPPGSYGMHGHEVAPKGKFEQAYYEKHPELWEKEGAAPYGDDRHDLALSSGDLNNIVRQTASRGAGLG